jgi:hypothetical protein
MDDSLGLNSVYPHQELIDSIWDIKAENDFLKNKLEELKYSIDSLQKLK